VGWFPTAGKEEHEDTKDMKRTNFQECFLFRFLWFAFSGSLSLVDWYTTITTNY